MKDSILPANPHHAVASVKTVHANTKGIFRPITSLTRPYSGWKLVEVSRKEVESQLASSEAWKEEVMEVCVLAIIVPSKAAIQLAIRTAAGRLAIVEQREVGGLYRQR